MYKHFSQYHLCKIIFLFLLYLIILFIKMTDFISKYRCCGYLCNKNKNRFKSRWFHLFTQNQGETCFKISIFHSKPIKPITLQIWTIFKIKHLRYFLTTRHFVLKKIHISFVNAYVYKKDSPKLDVKSTSYRRPWSSFISGPDER